MSAVVDTCAFCPKLCRHVCPVSVATYAESATPTAIVGVIRLGQGGLVDAALVDEALGLCNGCGACSRACALSMDVAGFLRECHSAPGAESLPTLPAGADTVWVEEANPKDPRSSMGSSWPAEVVVTPDALGYAAWRAGETARLGLVARHFAGRRVRTGSLAVSELLAAAGVPVEALAAPPLPARFVTCYEGADGKDGQLTCCGAREGFERAHTATASAMGAEAARRMAGLPHAVADTHCAAWLRCHGADARGPDAHVRR